MSDYFPVCEHFIKNIMMQKVQNFYTLVKKFFPSTILLVISEIYFFPSCSLATPRDTWPQFEKLGKYPKLLATPLTTPTH